MNCFDNATVAYFEFTDNSRHSFTVLLQPCNMRGGPRVTLNMIIPGDNTFAPIILFLDADKCFPERCKNGGTCYHERDLLKCNCTEAYEGERCESSKYVFKIKRFYRLEVRF